MKYETLTLRNSGYIDSETQEKIKNTRLLIAGCGVGSTIAEAALRMGFINLILLDGDTIEAHNLNRQAYQYSDIGLSKSEQLGKRLKSIYPEANITIYNEFLNKHNVSEIVSKSDIILDTIDFLDLSAITYLHDEAFFQKKPVITAASAGWGAVAIYFGFENRSNSGFRDMFELPKIGSVDHCSYLEHFGNFLRSIEHLLDESIIKAMEKTFYIMKDGKPCPAPHLSVGSFTVAALCLKLVCGLIDQNKKIKEGIPIVVNLNKEIV